MHFCKCLLRHACMCAWKHTHTHTHKHTHTHTHAHTHKRTHARMHARTHTHTVTHTCPQGNVSWGNGNEENFVKTERFPRKIWKTLIPICMVAASGSTECIICTVWYNAISTAIVTWCIVPCYWCLFTVEAWLRHGLCVSIMVMNTKPDGVTLW